MIEKQPDTGASAPIQSHLWVVDEWMDTIKVKTYKEATSRSYLQAHVPKYKHIFDSESGAAAFMVDRANKKCGEAAKNLEKARLRAKKCWKKFGLLIGPALQTGAERGK